LQLSHAYSLKQIETYGNNIISFSSTSEDPDLLLMWNAKFPAVESIYLVGIFNEVVITTIFINEKAKICYAGTLAGQVFVVSLKKKKILRVLTNTDSSSVTSIYYSSSLLAISHSSGNIEYMKEPYEKVIKIPNNNFIEIDKSNYKVLVYSNKILIQGKSSIYVYIIDNNGNIEKSNMIKMEAENVALDDEQIYFIKRK